MDRFHISRVGVGFQYVTVDILSSTANQRQGKADVNKELVVMNWEPEALGMLF